MIYCIDFMEESGSFQQQSPFSSSSTPSQSGGGGGGKTKKIIFLVIILLILGSIAYGATVLLGTSSEEPVEDTSKTDEFFIPTDTPTPTEEAEVTPEDEKTTPAPTSKTTSTPTPTKKAVTSTDSTDSATGLDRADLTIVVQNGSGESGVAKVVADKLTALGYTISSTGNADNYDYAQTVIKVNAASKAYLSLLKKDLEGDYTIGTATSDYTGTGDALVIVGKE